MALHRFTRACSSGRLFILLVLFQLVACGSGAGTGGQAATATLSWIAPSEREDGAPLALSEIAGYRVYYGSFSGEYPDRFEIADSSTVQTNLQDLPSGHYFFVFTTLDTDGQESDYSKEFSVSIGDL